MDTLNVLQVKIYVFWINVASLFNSKAKITTYKSLKWHFLVLYYLNQDSQYSLSPFFEHLTRFIANKDNGFVTFFISEKALNDMIIDVYQTGGDAPKNKLRKFKTYFDQFLFLIPKQLFFNPN